MRKKPFLAGLLCAFLIGLLRHGCPIYNLTHIPCPSCGVTRAWLAFLRGDLGLALRYHALFALIPIVLAAYVFRDRIRGSWKKTLDICLYVSGGILFLYGVLRWIGVVIIP